jgi:transposase
VLQYSFNWKCLSAIAGITVWNFYFRLFPGSIKAPQVIQFLEQLQRHMGGKLTIIWDGLPAHRSRLVREFVAGQRGRIELEFLPAYAPELNPVEYIWGYCKQHELPNLCPKDFAHLSHAARQALGRMRRRPTLVESFWKQAELF